MICSPLGEQGVDVKISSDLMTLLTQSCHMTSEDLNYLFKWITGNKWNP